MKELIYLNTEEMHFLKNIKDKIKDIILNIMMPVS